MDKILFHTRIRRVLPQMLSAFLLLTALDTTASSSGAATPFAELEEAEVMARIENMGCLIPVKLTKEVKDQIHRYTESYKKGAGEILGRAEMYFPIFEQYLGEAGAPEQLKYLSIVESALLPSAISNAGAAGLWQFMRQTGRYYGLEINRTVDQRRDPHRSTQSAIKYLTDLYESFGDWSLALAAYNSGPTRVREAMKRANSTDFWKIKKYLPAQTRNYVPAFIAATYLVNYYYLHDIKPVLQEDDMVFTSSIIIYEKLSFEDITAWTQLPLATIQKLNPAYLKDYIPASETGNYLVLPNRSIHGVVERLKRPDQAEWVGSMPAFIPAVENDLASGPSAEMETIESTNAQRASLTPLNTLPAMMITAVQSNEGSQRKEELYADKSKYPARTEKGLSFIYYRMKKGQSLAEIAQLKGLHIDELISWNEVILSENKSLTGAYIKIPAVK